MTEGKMWWASKTIWTNLVALIGAILLSWGYDANQWAEIATVLLAVVNLVLRLITHEPVAVFTEK